MAVEESPIGDMSQFIVRPSGRPDFESFPERELVIDNMREAVNFAAIAAHRDIQRLTGGKPEEGELEKDEKNYRTEVIDTSANAAFIYRLNQAPYRNHGVISEGAKEAAKEKLGKGMPQALGWFGSGDMKIDFGDDVVECTGWAILGQPDAFSAAAFTTHNGLMGVPNLDSGQEAKYFRKLITNGFFEDVISLENSTDQNLRNMADLAEIDTSDITIALLKRACNDEIVEQAEILGANIVQFERGDLVWCLKALQSDPKRPIVMLGRGGAPEGGLAMVAAKVLDGAAQVRLITDERNVPGIIDSSPIWTPDQFVPGAKHQSGFIFSAITQNTHYNLDPVEPVEGKPNLYVVHNILVDADGFHPAEKTQVEFPASLAA